ncbi:MAG TPA: hypothetical protein VMV78_06170 [Thiobacillus sp.]|nr:hypothetical protein [Thiobacillus sp.]
MNARSRIARVMAGVAIASQAAAQVTFYERQGFEGRSFTTEEPVSDFRRHDGQGLHFSHPLPAEDFAHLLVTDY